MPFLNHHDPAGGRRGRIRAGAALCIAVALPVLLPALAPAGVPAEETIELSYIGNDRDASMSELLSVFQRRHPRIKVFFGQGATRDRTRDPQRLLCAIAGGVPPDVVDFDRYAVGEWASRGAFMSLQEFYERDRDQPGGIREEAFYPACWQEAVYAGELFAVPKGTDLRLLFYNKDLLIQAGYVDGEGEAVPPRTWDELHEYAVRMTRYENNDAGNGALRVAGFVPLPTSGQNALYLYGWQNGGEFMSPDGRTCTVNDPRIVEALELYLRIAKDLGGAERLAVFQAGFQRDELDPFLQGKVAMTVMTEGFSNVIANYKKDMNFGAAPAPCPKSRQPLTWSGGLSYVIPRGCKRPAEAWELIKFLVSPEANQLLYEAQREERLAEGKYFLPAMNSQRSITERAFRDFIFSDNQLPERYKAMYRTSQDLMPVSRFRPVTPVGQMMYSELTRACDAALFHREPSAKAALDRAQSNLQRRLDSILRERTEPVVNLGKIVRAYAALVAAALAGLTLYFRRQWKARGYFRREYRAGPLFAAPYIFGFIIFTGGPILFSLIMAFCEYDIFNPPRFVGLRNFEFAFHGDPLFWKSLGNTLFMALGIPLHMAAGLGIALLLARETRGMSTFRTVFYLPSIVPVVASSLLWIWIFNPTNGLLNWSLHLIGIDGPAWLQNKSWSKPSLILMSLWSAGGGMIIWLAGLKGIPDHLYDAAAIDGAGAWQRFLRVTLPMLSPYIFFNFVTSLIGVFQIFSQAFIMTEGGPVDSTLFYAYHLFNQAFRFMDMGYACAMAWILFVIVFALTMAQLRLSKRWVHYESEG